MAKDNLMRKAFDHASRKALSIQLDEDFMLTTLRREMREYLDQYDKNITDEELDYFIKENMKGWRAIWSRASVEGLKQRSAVRKKEVVRPKKSGRKY